MANYDINIQPANAVADELTGITQHLDQLLDKLNQSVERFKAANHGQAPVAYSVAQNEWSQGQQAMRTALMVGRERLNEIIAAYVSGDAQGAGLF